MDIFMYSEMSYYFPDSLCSGADCNRAGSEKLVWLSGGLVCSATSDLHRKTSRLCKDVLRRAPLWRYTGRGCCRKGNTSRSVNHVHQCLHDMTDRGCTVLLAFIRVSPRPTGSFPQLFSSYWLTNEHTNTAPARHIFTPPMNQNNPRS